MLPRPGRRGDQAQLRAWLRYLSEDGEEAARFLVEAMRDTECPWGVRVQVAETILEKIFGKEDRNVNIHHEVSPMLLRVVGISEQELLALNLQEVPLPPEVQAAVDVEYEEIAAEDRQNLLALPAPEEQDEDPHVGSHGLRESA